MRFPKCPKFSKSDQRFPSYDRERELTREWLWRNMRLGRHFPLYNYIGQNGQKMTENGHILPNNDPNDLKFWHKMYLRVFHQFPKFRQNLPKNAPFLAKNGHFCDFKKCIVNFGRFWPKIAVSAHIGSRKMAKTQNIKIPIGRNCSRGPKVHLYQFLGELDHFPRNA